MTMNDIMDRAMAQAQTEKKRTKEFIALYSAKNTQDVDWVILCNDLKHYGCYKLGFFVIYELLKANEYVGTYKNALLSRLDFFHEISKKPMYSYHSLFCGTDITNQVVFRYQKNENQPYVYSIMGIKSVNKFIRERFGDFLNTGRESCRSCSQIIAEVFEESFGDFRCKISKAEDFTPETLFQQVKFYREYFKEDEFHRYSAIQLIVNFYRWVVRAFPEHDFFKNSFCLSDRLLFSNKCAELIERNYYFTTLNPANIPYGKERVCFLLKGLANQSTRITNDDFSAIDFSSLKNQFYRDLVIEFAVTSTSVSTIAAPITVQYACDAMQALYDVKQTKGYPNPRLDYLTNQEAIFIRQYFDAHDVTIPTKNNKIGAARRFIAYCVNQKAIQVDDIFFDYLSQYEEPNKNTAKTVSDEYLVAIHKELLKRSADSLFYKEILVMFHLAIQTEFRINQICHLQVDCIKPTMKPNQFMIQTNSKTSHGRKNNYVISNQTYRLLIDIIEETEAIREESHLDSLKNYIFVYKGKTITGNTLLMNNTAFLKTIQEICDSVGIPRCNAANLRDTHMTKSLEHIMRTGKSDLEMSVLSKHKHIDTTKNHYIEMELEKMLESTYGITIGTELIETDSKVIDEIPAHLTGEENDVEDGCGKCAAETCVMTNALPCMACKHFITTVKHEVFFKKAIENVNRLIESTKNRHDKEDLVTIKELYVLYLKAIIKHKESATNEN